MALKVIGSGLGRTGTLSLKLALEQLGLPCHHMMEVFPRPESLPMWVAAGEGRPDWPAIFEGFSAAVDYPSCKFYRQLAAFYPDAKVVHSVRDPDKWFDSTQATIFKPDGVAQNAPPHMKAFFDMVMGDFRAHIHDRAAMTDYFRRHDEEVRRTIPAGRLLVFEATQGWEPLCAFLGLPLPDAPFPKVNSTEEFQARVSSIPGVPTPGHGS